MRRCVMYIYDLSVSMSDKKMSFIENKDLLVAIKEAIDISNNSFSAVRYKRTIEFVELIDDKKMLLRMRSRDETNPTRSLSSLSRALLQNERTKNSNLLDGHLVNGCVFNAKLIDSNKSQKLEIEAMTDSEVIKMLVEIVTNPKYESISKDTLDSVKKILFEALNSIE